MTITIIGGSGSGKSAFAEECAVKLSQEDLIYIATMNPFDEESKLRVLKHQKMRQNKNFNTIECYTHLENLKIKSGQTVLLECISNLTANEMFGESGRKENISQLIFEGVRNLKEHAKHLIVVTNNVFDDGAEYDEYTRQYQKTLAKINDKTARMSEEVIEIVHGIPLKIKSGGQLCEF